MHPPHPKDWIELRSDGLSVAIDPQGAQLSHLRDAQGRELLWNGDPAHWTGRAPILFPIVGSLQGGEYRWQHNSFALPRHGFARGRRFEVVSRDPHAVLMRLRDDEASRAVYPFAFELDVAFRVEGRQLSMEARVHNRGDEAMPASLGFHPAFRWPLPYGSSRSAHFIEFEHEEPTHVRRLDKAGLLTAVRHATPVCGSRLPLGDALFIDDALIFEGLESRSLVYGAEDGPQLRVEFDEANFLGLWTKPGAGFLCIEPWHGVSDPVDFCGELDAKPGISLLSPGERQQLGMRVECLPEG
jgi:galactose mutarotase-like enzyme